MKKIIIISAVILVIAISSGTYYFTGTPTYSLYKLKKAIQSHDSTSFNKYADTERIVNSLVSEATKELETEDNNLFAGLAQTLMLSMKDQIKNEINKSVEEISSGKDNNLATVKIKSVEKSGMSANVVLINNKDEEIRISMIQYPERYWKIVSINVDDFKKISPETIGGSDKKTSSNKEAKKNLSAKFGEKVAVDTGWFITVEKPETYVTPKDSFDKPKSGNRFVTVSILYTNETSEEDTINPENLTLKDAEGQSYKMSFMGVRKPEISDGDLVPANDKLKGYATYEVSENIEIAKAVYSNKYVTISME